MVAKAKSPPLRVPLSMASTEQLLEEIRRRWPIFVLLGIEDEILKPNQKAMCVAEGEQEIVLKLISKSVDQLAAIANKGIPPNGGIIL